MFETQNTENEKAILVGVGRRYAIREDDLEDDFSHLDELALLAHTAGAETVGVLVQARDDIESAYYLGKGKAEELKYEVEETGANTVIFDNDLSPAQVSNLEKLLNVKVLDRSGLILDIFALRAKTREARTQVELAQLKYLLPRLTRQWTHLSRQQGGIGMRGPGETQLETDRRSIRQRIGHLESVLEKIEKRRETGRKKRRDVFKTALVGYTNAGKSTLLNTLSGADVPVEDKLFKTLDSVTRLIKLEQAPEILLSDTVGFIRNLPHDLIASFKSTLEEVREADLLLHVIDICNSEWEEQEQTVNMVLAELNAAETDSLLVFNKIDRLENPALIDALKNRYPKALFVSSADNCGIDDLKSAILAHATKDRLRMTMRFAPQDNALLAEIYRYAIVHETTAEDAVIKLTFTISKNDAARLRLEER